MNKKTYILINSRTVAELQTMTESSVHVLTGLLHVLLSGVKDYL